MTIPVLRGRLPDSWERESRELEHYASGRADADAAAVPGDTGEPWLNVIAQHEPAAFRAIDRLLSEPDVRAKIHGTVIDVGAGTCILSAALSRVPDVDRVYALDLSESFLTTTGARLLRHLKADETKLTFVASDFNHIPLPDASVDAAFIFAAIHHSLSPIKTLQEVGRILKPGGTVMILEAPSSVISIRKQRRRSLALSQGVTEIAYTLDELSYLIANANIGPCEVKRWDILSRPGPRRWIRAAVRRMGLEHVILNPPNYLFVITRQSADGAA